MEKTILMLSQELIEKLKYDYFNSHYSQRQFARKFHDLYGFDTHYQLKRLMGKLNISHAEKQKYNHSKYNYDGAKLELIDAFGIPASIGKEYESFVLPGHFKKVGVLSDIHFPFHDLSALTLAINHLRNEQIDCLYLNGDIFDFYSISKHEKDPDLRDFSREVELCRELLQKLRNIFHCPIYFKMGNHEERYARSLQVNAEEFAQLHDLQFDIFFRLDKLNITLIEGWQGCQMGDLLVVHGHEIMVSGGINPSQLAFNKTICNTLMGHVHRTSQTIKKNGMKEYIKSYSTGCLTMLSPKYMPFSHHNHGFAIVELFDGESKVTNFRIDKGKILV